MIVIHIYILFHIIFHYGLSQDIEYSSLCYIHFPSGTVVKNLSAHAGDARDMGLTAGMGRSRGVGNGSILAWNFPLTEEPGGLQSMGSRRVGHD